MKRKSRRANKAKSRSHLRVYLFPLFLALGFYFLGTLVIRLHLTQLAYQFRDLKNYERSLKEENYRLRAELESFLSFTENDIADYEEPQPDRIFLIP